jgi:hypothetical protein
MREIPAFRRRQLTGLIIGLRLIDSDSRLAWVPPLSCWSAARGAHRSGGGAPRHLSGNASANAHRPLFDFARARNRAAR